ncbi:hypothetical protein R7Z10_14390 [Vibrio sp. Vb1018]|uniref:hypothetical protein n=1 Tax=Vibrio sp. Vb1018 TaxID=3074636 RepID=UPI002963FE4C|nr:hypothetical protein [Vibrio sp. Vb1018]MDW1821578.1 hypothetical protein [Vibrio sp. Vb1018]
MAIPWIIGGIVAAAATAVVAAVSDDSEEREREARRAARSEKERLDQEAKEKLERAKVEEALRKQQQKKKNQKDFAVRKAAQIIEAHRVNGISASKLASIAIESQDELLHTAKSAFVSSKTAKDKQFEIENLKNQLIKLEKFDSALDKGELDFE